MGELKPLGIKATIIEPGFFRTDFLDATSVNYGALDLPDYAEASAKFRAWHDEMNHQQVGDPAKLGTLLIHVADMDEPPARLAAGSDGSQWAAEKGKQLQGEATKWRDLSASTDGEAPANVAASLPAGI